MPEEDLRKGGVDFGTSASVRANNGTYPPDTVEAQNLGYGQVASGRRSNTIGVLQGKGHYAGGKKVRLREGPNGRDRTTSSSKLHLRKEKGCRGSI